MTITFSSQDRQLVAEKLEQADWQASESSIDVVLHGVEAAFRQQFDSEVEYMINELDS